MSLLSRKFTGQKDSRGDLKKKVNDKKEQDTVSGKMERISEIGSQNLGRVDSNGEFADTQL